MILREVAYDFHPCRVPVDLKDRWSLSGSHFRRHSWFLSRTSSSRPNGRINYPIKGLSNRSRADPRHARQRILFCI